MLIFDDFWFMSIIDDCCGDEVWVYVRHGGELLDRVTQ
jgi:hypothetical protein